MYEDTMIDHAHQKDLTPPGNGSAVSADHALHDLVTLPGTGGHAAPAGGGADAPADDFLAFYNLRENPFSDAVNPAYFYKTDLHEEVCIRMMLAVRHNISLGLVTGPSGSGKTLISQVILQDLDPVRYQPVLVLVSPGMTKTALLREILQELDVPLPEGFMVRTQDLLKLLHDHVIELYHHNRKLVVLIDECHFLSSSSLHMIRTLSNIEVPERKLLTCLLFAEDIFLRRLSHYSYESLRNRMYLRGELPPLSANDTAEYVKFRLMVAGRMQALFDEEALAVIHERSAAFPGASTGSACSPCSKASSAGNPCSRRTSSPSAPTDRDRSPPGMNRYSKTRLRLGRLPRQPRPPAEPEAPATPPAGTNGVNRDEQALLFDLSSLEAKPNLDAAKPPR